MADTRRWNASAVRRINRRANKKTAEIIPFETLVRRELDADQIADLIRRTPGIKPIDRKMVSLKLIDGLLDVEISAEEGINYSRSSVTRHLSKAMPEVEHRFYMDKVKAGA